MVLIRVLRPPEDLVGKTAENNNGGSGSKCASYLPSLVYIIQLTYVIETGIPKKGNHDCDVCYLQYFYFNLVSKMLMMEDPGSILDYLCVHWLCSDGKDYKAISVYSSFGKSCKI